MNRIDAVFQKLGKKRKGALVTYIMAGDPTLQATYKYVLAMEEAGADIIELGIPFSDPVADGPTIQRAGVRALKSKTTPTGIFNLVRKIRKHSEVPIVFMTYYNIVHNIGEKEFVKKMKSAGADGLIVPDMPVEESSTLSRICKEYDISLILLVSPASDNKRVAKIVEKTTGFLYVVSTFGVTGERKSISGHTAKLVMRIKPLTRGVPLGVGFGISTPEHVSHVIKSGANGAVVGSAIVKMIENNKNINDIKRFVKELKYATTATSST
ncbi:MAG: tryptophan synthase subunit alpha [Thermoplasmata archaeon]